MTLNQLIIRAATAFNHSEVLDYWDTRKGEPKFSADGDMLAQAVVEELLIAYNRNHGDGERLAACVKALMTASETLERAAHALANMSRESQREVFTLVRQAKAA